MRIAVIMKEVSKAVDTLWPATDSSKHLLHRYVQSISLRLTDSSEEQLRGAMLRLLEHYHIMIVMFLAHWKL
jgi:hypothetical protein